jgi:hypothetical protein
LIIAGKKQNADFTYVDGKAEGNLHVIEKCSVDIKAFSIPDSSFLLQSIITGFLVKSRISNLS